MVIQGSGYSSLYARNPNNLSSPGPQLPASGYTGQYRSNPLNYSPKPAGSVLGSATGFTTSRPSPAPSLSGLFQPPMDAAQAGYDAELGAANSALDYERSNLLSQMDSLGAQRQNSINSLSTALQGVEKEVGTQKQRSADQTQDAINQAGSVAKTTQSQNRNVLRALGILNSSAAGEQLTKPITEFDNQRAVLVKANLDRINSLDDFYNQKLSEHKNAVQSIETQFNDLVGRIQNDLRFNDRQRTDAVRQATSALQSRKAEIANSMNNYALQVDQLKGNYMKQLAEQANYVAPTANTNLISSMGLTNTSNTGRTNAQIFDRDDEERRRLSNPYLA